MKDAALDRHCDEARRATWPQRAKSVCYAPIIDVQTDFRAYARASCSATHSMFPLDQGLSHSSLLSPSSFIHYTCTTISGKSFDYC